MAPCTVFGVPAALLLVCAFVLEVAPDWIIPSEELELHAVRSGGPGGQNVNKVASKVELRFLLGVSSALSPGQKRRLAVLTREGRFFGGGWHRHHHRRGAGDHEFRRHRGADRDRSGSVPDEDSGRL